MYNYICLECDKKWRADKDAKTCECGGELKRIGKASGVGFKGTQEQGKQTKYNKL